MTSRCMSNSTSGIFAGVWDPSGLLFDTIDYITIATAGNAADFGDIVAKQQDTWVVCIINSW